MGYPNGSAPPFSASLLLLLAPALLCPWPLAQAWLLSLGGQDVSGSSTAGKGIASLTGSFLDPGLSPHESGCSCYTVRNRFGFSNKQPMCVCHNVCFNGSTLLGNFLRLGEGVAAADGLAAGEGILGMSAAQAANLICVPAPEPLPQKHRQKLNSPLTPVLCRHSEAFMDALRRALKEVEFLGTNDTVASWDSKPSLASRSATWLAKAQGGKGLRRGTTYLTVFDRSTTNIFHFITKFGVLLLTNNASKATVGLPFPVDRFLFPRSRAFLNRVSEHGKDSWQGNIFAFVMRKAAAAFASPSALESLGPPSLASSAALLDGRIEFEEQFVLASEENPMCFDRLVFPATLKAIFFPGGVSEATLFKEEFLEYLHLQPQMARSGVSGPVGVGKFEPLQVLYIVRRGKRRVFTPESEKMFQALLASFNFNVTEVNLGELSFVQQMEAINRADIIVSLHGAALTNAALGRNSTVLLEIFPYKVFHVGYYQSSLNSGLTYMMHQVRKNSPQPRDEDFLGLSTAKCMNKNPACKEYHVHLRKVELGTEDLKELRKLLARAEEVVRAMKGGEGALLTNHRALPGCQRYTMDVSCRTDLMQMPHSSPCVVDEDCQEL